MILHVGCVGTIGYLLRSVVLNGQLARLGQFDDLRSFRSPHDTITIGWRCEPRDADSAGGFATADPFAGEVGFYSDTADPPTGLNCEIEFDADPTSPARDLVQLQPRLRRCEISLEANASEGGGRRFWINTWRADDAKQPTPGFKLPDNASEALRASLKYEVAVDDASKKALSDIVVAGQPVGCLLQHFLPARLTLRYGLPDEAARTALAVLQGERMSYRRRRFVEGQNFVLPRRTLELVRSKIQQHLDQATSVDVLTRLAPLLQEQRHITFADWYERFIRLPVRAQTAIKQALQDKPEELVAPVRETAPSGYGLISTGIGYAVQATEYMDRFFSQSVRYLGPLRDEPKPLYPLAVTADPADVGLRGEHTAAVMDLHKSRLVRYIPARDFGPSKAKRGPIGGHLQDAIQEWLAYLGVAEKVSTFDKGKLGHELKVTVAPSGMPQDLTHVGVGVSQVLPILVMCLLADSDTTLIIEQPELHLHPRVQTLLADFFLSMAYLGKQCIIETHSEYLISRLRYRAADAPEETVSSLVKLYFAEPQEGGTSFRSVVVNKYGAVQEWPEGFFDQGQREAESILRAAMEKRKQERGK